MKKNGFILQGNELKRVTNKQKISQWWYGVIEPYIIKYGDFMLQKPKRTSKYVKQYKPKTLPSGVIISTEAACKFVDYIYSHNSEDNSARIAITKCVCQTALNKPKEPQWKDMALLYAADMYTTLKHTGIKEKFRLIETAEEAKEMLNYFNGCGLMHNVLYCNSSGKWTFVMCNCDDEVCVPFRSYMAGRKEEISAGPEIIAMKRERCVGADECGKCIERCHVKANFIDKDGKSNVKYDECLGCGLCVSTCKHNARMMIPRRDYKHEDILTTKILLGTN